LSAEHEQIQIVTQEMHQMLDDEARRKKRKFGEDASASSPSLEPVRPLSKYNLQMESGQFKIPTTKPAEEKVDAAPSESVSSGFASPLPLDSGRRRSNNVETSTSFSPISISRFSPISSVLKGISKLWSPRMAQ